MQIQRKLAAVTQTARTALLILLALTIGASHPTAAAPQTTEEPDYSMMNRQRVPEIVRVTYEGFLRKCQSSCRIEPMGKGKVDIRLEAENKSFAWGFERGDLRIGVLTLDVFIKASRQMQSGRFTRYLDVHPRVWHEVEKKQLTWGDKSLTAASWKAFPRISVSAAPYREGLDVVTPKVEVTVEQVFPRR